MVAKLEQIGLVKNEKSDIKLENYDFSKEPNLWQVKNFWRRTAILLIDFAGTTCESADNRLFW